ncbi:MAG: transporter [Leptospirillia bacterium]
MNPKRLRNTFLIPFAALLLWTSPAEATRPFVAAESAVALPPGGMRLEAGMSHSKWDNVHAYAIDVEISYSLYANLDLEVEVPFAIVGGANTFGDGIGDIWTKAKVNFIKERAANPLSVSGLVGVKFPTGDDVTGTDDPDVRLAALASKAFGPVTAHANLIYTFTGDNGNVDLDDVLALAVGFEIESGMDRVTGIGEVLWEQDRYPAGNNRMEVMGGGVYAISDRLRADLTLGIGIDDGTYPDNAAPDFRVGFGLSHDL